MTMRRAGAVVVVVSGVFAIVFSVASLFLDGIESVYDLVNDLLTPSSDEVVGDDANEIELGLIQVRWLIIILSLLVVILGVFMIFTKREVVSGLLVASFCVAGMLMGTSLVAIVLGIAAVGGILTVADGLRE